MARSKRQRHGAILVIAVGLGLGVVAFLLGGDDSVDDGAPERPATSAPSVLGVVVTPEQSLPAAVPAAPATFDLADDAVSPTTTRRVTPRPAAPASTTTTTTPGPTLIPPTSISNTTTTTAPPTTVTFDSTTTSTTEPTTTTAP